MPEFGAYAGYILGSYLITGVILGVMIAASLVAARSARIRLARIEEMRALNVSDDPGSKIAAEGPASETIVAGPKGPGMAVSGVKVPEGKLP